MDITLEQQRFDQSLALLQKEACLEYSGEYGAELTTFIPFVAWLKREGHLAGRRIVTYAGMRPYYFFLDEGEFAGKTEPRRWLPENDRYWPFNCTYTAITNPWHVYPDYRQYYAARGRRFKRPLLFIQNKFAMEWKVGPINYIPLKSLSLLLQLTSDRFDVVYSRPRAELAGYSRDENNFCDYPDRAIIKQFPHVLDFEAECQAQGAAYNRAKLEILAQARLFVAVQGGGAHALACFGNSLFLLLHHQQGFSGEYPHAYKHGPYRYLSPNPVHLLVTRNFPDFELGMEMISHATVSESNIVLPAADRELVRRFTL